MDHPQVSGAVPAPVGGKLLMGMSREGGREKRWHNAHNYVRCTVASAPLSDRGKHDGDGDGKGSIDDDTLSVLSLTLSCCHVVPLSSHHHDIHR